MTRSYFVFAALVAALLAPDGHGRAQSVVYPFARGAVLHASDLNAMQQKLVSAQGGALTAAQINAAWLAIPANPSIPTCPVASCPTTNAAGGPVMAALAAYGSTQLGPQWEYELYSGLYMNSGRGSATGGIAAPGAKMAAYFGAMQDVNSGPGWGINWNISRNFSPATGSGALFGQPGSGQENAPGGMAANMSTIGAEGDLNNADLDCNGQSGCFVVNIFLNTTSKFTSLAGIFFGASAGQTAASYHDAIYIGGKANGGTADVASDNDIYSQGGGAYGYHASGVHAVAGILVESTGQHDVQLTGTSSSSDLNIISGSPAKIVVNGKSAIGDVIVNTSTDGNAISTQGTHVNGSGYQDQSTAGSGANMSGTYSYAAFVAENATTKLAFTAAPNQEVCFNHADYCVTYDSASSKLVYSIGSKRVFAVDNSGNMSIAGTLTQSGSP